MAFLAPETIGRESCVVIDVETTGLDPAQHRIIEIAAVKYICGRIVARLCTLINPGNWQPVPFEITQLTGITTPMLADAPTFDTVADVLQGLVQDSLVVGHNLPFDLSFISAELLHYNLPALHDFTELDTLTYAKSLDLICLPTDGAGRKSYRLCDLAQGLNVPQSDAHRALADALTTFKVYQKLRETECLNQGFWGY